MQKPFTVDVRPVRSETISAEEYLKLQSQNPHLIERAVFVPPRPGAPGFGSFQVRYSRIRHKQLSHG